MKKILLGVVAGLMVASCSKNETIELNQDEIQFSVVTNKAAKAADVYCNNNLPEAFKVYANHTLDSKIQTYIDGDNIVKGGSDATPTWTNETGNRYWPNSGSLDFYAHVNAGDAFKWVSGEIPTIENFTVETDVTKQVDLLYATTSELTRATTTKVALNFRHALAQIVFQAKNTNKNLHIDIAGVSIGNVISKGTFTYPKTTTAGWVEDHNSVETNNTLDNQGSWALSTEKTVYPVTFANVSIPGGVKETVEQKEEDKIYALTTTVAEGKEFSSNALLLLPEQAKDANGGIIGTTAWTPAEGETGYDGTYFLITCKIRNVAAQDGQVTDNDVYLYGSKDEYANIAIPVSLTWKQGVKYIYTFVFGQGNAGYIPEGPDPVLVPITFTVSVDDFTNVTKEDVNMETTTEQGK